MSLIGSFFLFTNIITNQLLLFVAVYYEGLQDKLTQGRDARAALDALREEHRERLRREAEEAERQRQMQMALKLEIMRKKKQEYLQYQRQLAMQRMQVTSSSSPFDCFNLCCARLLHKASPYLSDMLKAAVRN